MSRILLLQFLFSSTFYFSVYSLPLPSEESDVRWLEDFPAVYVCSDVDWCEYQDGDEAVVGHLVAVASTLRSWICH